MKQLYIYTKNFINGKLTLNESIRDLLAIIILKTIFFNAIVSIVINTIILKEKLMLRRRSLR